MNHASLPLAINDRKILQKRIGEIPSVPQAQTPCGKAALVTFPMAATQASYVKLRQTPNPPFTFWVNMREYY